MSAGIKKVLDYLPLLAAAVGIGVAWGVLSSAQISQGKRIDKVEDKQVTYDQCMERIDHRLTHIEDKLGVDSDERHQ